MGTYTTNLNMYKTNMLTDGNDTFDFKRDINDNLDIIDTAVGKLSTLTTTDKSSLVNAIIELVTSLGGKASKDLDNLSATGQAILDGKVEVEALLAQNGYAKFSWKENNVISSFIIQWGNHDGESGNGIKEIKFPISFPNSYKLAIADFQAQAYFSSSSNTAQWLAMGGSFTYPCDNSGFQVQNSITQHYIAIGY